MTSCACSLKEVSKGHKSEVKLTEKVEQKTFRSFYIGMTTRMLHTRALEHIAGARKHPLKSTFGEHYKTQCFYFAAAERLVSHLARIQPIVPTNVHFSSLSTCSSSISCLVFFTEQTCLQINTTDHKTENSRVVRHRPAWAIW